MSGTNQHTESQLLLQIAAGDEQAFATLVKTYSGLLFTYLNKLTKDREIASDVVQEIFTQLWLTRESLKGVESFRSWLFVISRNHAVRLLKHIDRENRKQQEWFELTQTSAVLMESPDQAALQEAYNTLMAKAVDRLPPQQKKAWISARIEGKKYADIAREMQLSRETVKKYLQIASSSIAEYLKDYGLTLLLAFLVKEL